MVDISKIHEVFPFMLHTWQSLFELVRKFVLCEKVANLMSKHLFTAGVVPLCTFSKEINHPLLVP